MLRHFKLNSRFTGWAGLLDNLRQDRKRIGSIYLQLLHATLYLPAGTVSVIVSPAVIVVAA